MSTTWRLMVATIALSMSVTACGEDSTGGGGVNNNNGQADAGDDTGGTTDTGGTEDTGGTGGTEDTGGTDTGGDDTGTADTGSVSDAGDTGATDTGASDTGTADTGTTDTGTADTGTADTGTADTGTADTGTDTGTVTSDWDPSSVAYELVVQDGNQSCCFDVNHDGTSGDNALGSLLTQFGGLADTNTAIQQGIDNGSYLLVFEYDAITSLTADQFPINVWLADYDGITMLTRDGSATNPLLIDPATIDANGQPLYQLPDGELATAALTTGEGTIPISIPFAGVPLSAPLYRAQISADLDSALSSLDENGVFLSSGRLGGAIHFDDAWDAFNDFAGSPACTCLGLGGQDLITYTPGDPGTASCRSTRGNSCGSSGTEAACAQIGDNCGLLTLVMGANADTDLDSDGTTDAMSVGAYFQAAGANITGVAP